MSNEEKTEAKTYKPQETKLVLDKERTFILDLNAYAALDLLYEDKSYQMIERDVIGMRPYALRAFLWAGLKHEDPDLTIEKVSEYIDITNIQDFSAKVYEALINKNEKEG